MARVKICEICGRSNSASELFCAPPCGSSLALIPESDDDPPSEIGNSVATAQTQRELPPLHVEIAFPWGVMPVDMQLRIGRDRNFSPLADRLAEWGESHGTQVGAVSGIHAEVFIHGAALHVRHLGKTNPTYVDGRALATGEVARLSDGTVLAFSRALITTVRFG